VAVASYLFNFCEERLLKFSKSLLNYCSGFFPRYEKLKTALRTNQIPSLCGVQEEFDLKFPFLIKRIG